MKGKGPEGNRLKSVRPVFGCLFSSLSPFVLARSILHLLEEHSQIIFHHFLPLSTGPNMSSEQLVTPTSPPSNPPWRVSGAPNFPPILQFMDMDTDHVVFRKFKRLHLYSLLFQQRQLARIDEKIADMQLEDGPKSTSKFERLTRILPKLEKKLKKYDEALLRQESLMKLTVTPDRLVKKFREYAKPELAEELNKGNGWNDLVSLGCTPKLWLHNLVDESPKLQKLFETPRSKQEQLPFELYSEKKVRFVEKVIINLTFCIMVIGPLFALTYLTSVTAKLLTITAALFITSVIASILSNTIENASLAVIAGYTAILVVFLSNNG
ncbi:hypothetical protein PV04_02278 [Phialophora macrospora]|uniref:DUF6594 domain-containing protein n=1 Tax=Phialophora macrospora TaxID=1851006 RepID=A0A0D2CXT4_9EURO|nr:hypothetical protein PV04_02278 [Phialophora macrospora]